MIDETMHRFNTNAHQVLEDEDIKSEFRLQSLLLGYVCTLSTIASNANPHHHKFQSSIEPILGSKPYHSDMRWAIKGILTIKRNCAFWYS